jgi:ADP-ribosyl-[dinitrogen reductase] hydrolase
MLGLNKKISLEDRYKGCLLGLAVGDSLGAAVESLDRDSFTVKDMPTTVCRDDIKPGYWTDDTSMALCLAESLIICKEFSPMDQMYRYLKWLDGGYLSPFGYAYGVGNTIFNSLNTFMDNPNEPYAGLTDPKSAGNGSLMRIASIPMFYRKDLRLAEKYAVLSSRTTHQTKEALDACQVFSLMVIRALNGLSKNEILSNDIAKIDGLSPEIKKIAEGSYKKLSRDKIESTGYVAHSLEAALWAFYNSKSFKEGALLAVNLGDDADTTAAIFGQLAGAYYGYEAIPKKWRDLIAMKDKINEMAVELLNLSNKLNSEKPNIYLDIDGVLLANDKHPANYVHDFLKYILTNYPDTTYWLTTHCQGDANRPIQDVGHLFNTETVELMKKIQPTTWLHSPSKTSAIDFTKPFLWFDDDLFISERNELIEHSALDNWIEVDLKKDPNQLGKFLQSFPTPIEIIRADK